MRLLIAVACVALLSLGPTLADAAELPHARPFQSVLRGYLAHFTEADFVVARRPLDLQPSYLPDPDSLYRFWLLVNEGERSLPPTRGLRVPAASFTLSRIEGAKDIALDVAGVVPEALAWWDAWDFAGNPYRDSAPVRNRALVAAIVDLLMLDRAHEEGRYTRSDFLGGSLIRLAYTYVKLKPHLPSRIQSAYETGLLRFMARLEEWGPTGVHADMDMFALVGLWYTAQALDDPDTRRRAEQQARLIMRKHFKPAGYVDHGGGYDPSYNGISTYFLVWAALASDWQFLRPLHERACRLKAFSSFPEPETGLLVGPTHFSTTMSRSAARDQWARKKREVASAMLTDEAAYLLSVGRPGRHKFWGVPDALQMRSEITRQLGRRINPEIKKRGAIAPGIWKESHWCRSLNFAYDYYARGTYARLMQIRRKQGELLSPPVARRQAFVERFGDDWTIVRSSSFAIGIHTGRLSWWKGLSGFGGGAISAFWTPSGGSILLGRNKNRPHPASERDTWANVEAWHTNAISGRTAAGKAFSTARVRHPSARGTNELGDQEQVVLTVEGAIGADHDEGRAMEDGALVGPLRYSRHFMISASRVQVRSLVAFDSRDKISELFESVPLFSSPLEARPRSVVVEVLVGARWRAPSSTWVPGVLEVRVRRLGGGMSLKFDRPRRVRLARNPGPYGPNLQIDLRLSSSGESADSRLELGYELLPWAP